MKNLLINPFERIAGWKALAIGICIISLTAVFGKINNLLFDNLLHVTLCPHTFGRAFLGSGLNWVIVSIVMLIAGKLFSTSKIRIIDVAGTMALSCAPLLLIALFGFLPFFPKDTADVFRLFIFGLMCIIPMIWTVILLY